MIATQLTNHAVERFHERVIPNSSKLEAQLALQQFVSLGRLRPNPRHWMSDQHPEPGKRFIYWAGRPRVCAILVDNTVVTVITAELVRASGRRTVRSVAPPRPQPPLTKKRWRWDRMVDTPQAAGKENEAA
jgi:hypothetical protein